MTLSPQVPTPDDLGSYDPPAKGFVIEDIKALADGALESDRQVVRARRRLLRAYRRVKKNGGFRRLTEQLGLPNVSYVYNFVVKGMVPANAGIRASLMQYGLVHKAQPMDDLMLSLWHTLSEHHVGREHAISRRELRLVIFGAGPEVASDGNNNLYDRKLRAMIETLNHKHKGLVCSDSAKGYWWAPNLKEGLEAVQRSMSRPQKIMANLAHLKRNIIHTFGGQESMFDQ